MRKHVTPSDPLASIPDPSRGRMLPTDGAPVEWSPYWAGMEARREVAVADIPPDAPAEDEAREEVQPVELPAPELHTDEVLEQVHHEG